MLCFGGYALQLSSQRIQSRECNAAPQEAEGLQDGEVAYMAAKEAGQGQPLDAHDAVAKHDEAPPGHEGVEARGVQRMQTALLRPEHLPKLLLNAALWCF